MKKKRILIISVIMLIFIIFFTLIILSNKMNEKRINLSITMNSKISDIVYDENKINIYDLKCHKEIFDELYKNKLGK